MTQLSDRVATSFIPAPRKSLVKRVFPFPNPVNEKAARVTAGLVVALALTALMTSQIWLVALLAAGFLLRLAWGPRISPFGVLSVKVLAPRFGEAKLVPGPPKRFAQGIGAALSIAALVTLLLGVPTAGWAMIVLLVIAASLEAFAGICLGCIIFGFLMRRGIIPADICEECANFSR